MQEFNLGIGSQVSITLWCKCCSWEVLGMGGVGTLRHRYKLPPPHTPLFCYISLLYSLNMNQLFCWQLILIFLYLTSAWMFFFHTLATASPTSYHIKTVCSCWVLKPSINACLLNLVPSASFLTQSDWLEKKADQLLCICKEALGTRLMPTKTMVRAMCKCVQKPLALLQWDWLIWKIQSLVYRKKLILIWELGCV